jgi:signal transduction histidine kinase
MEQAGTSLSETEREPAVPLAVQQQAEAVVASQVASVVTHGAEHIILRANRAFASFVGRAAEQLCGQPLSKVCGEAKRMNALLERALSARTSELLLDVEYQTSDGGVLHAATLVQPVGSPVAPAALVQIIPQAAPPAANPDMQTAYDLQHANEQLLLTSLREHDLAERWARATQEAEWQSHRTAMLSEASRLLGSSLELGQVLELAARLPLPELAACSILLLHAEGIVRCTVAHRDGELEASLRRRLDALRTDADLLALSARVRTSGVPELVQLSGAAPMPPILASTGALAAAALPVTVRGANIGCLVLLDSSPDQLVDELPLVLELATRIGAAVDNARLYHQAQLALRMREEVLAIVSHDLRNPLAAISMVVDRLLKQVPEQDRLQLGPSYAIIKRSSTHIRHLIEELLEVASIQNEQLSLTRTEVTLASLFDESVEMLAPVATKKGVGLVQLPDVPALRLRCDAPKLVRVLANLIGNAIKFTPEGGTVSLCALQQEQLLLVRVSDTGIGIAQSELPKLFERYWKGEQTGRGGMGLGLYIARGIVEAHGGRIWVESSERGSTFSFTLPLED